MIKTWARNCGMTALATLGMAIAADAGVVTVYSNDFSPGDFVTGTGDSSVAIAGSSGWAYTDLRPGGTVGINDTYSPTAGETGSAYISTSSTAGKASIEYRFAAGDVQNLSNLTTLSYDWMIGQLDPAYAVGSVALRLIVSVTGSDGIAREGQIVWEPAENNKSVAAGTPWQTSNALAGTFWTGKSSPLYNLGKDKSGAINIGNRLWNNLAWWSTTFGTDNVKLLGFNMGLGSGGYAGTTKVAVDNLTYAFNDGEKTTFNFEVRPVPEPGSVVMGLIAGGLGLAGAAWRRRRIG